jgi:hypothetical protein
MLQVWFEPVTSVSERAKTVRSLDRAASVIGLIYITELYFLAIYKLNTTNCWSQSLRIEVSYFELSTQDVTTQAS